MGPLGNAAIIKVITNMLAFIHLLAAGEALMLAKQGRLDLAKSFEAILNSSGNSFVHETESQVILSGSYNIGFTMDLALKTSVSPCRWAANSACRSKSLAWSSKPFVRSKAQYGGGAWSSQVVKLLEDAVGTDLRPRLPRSSPVAPRRHEHYRFESSFDEPT